MNTITAALQVCRALKRYKDMFNAMRMHMHRMLLCGLFTLQGA